MARGAQGGSPAEDLRGIQGAHGNAYVSLPFPIIQLVPLPLRLDPSGTYYGELDFDLENSRITPRVSTHGERAADVYGELALGDRARKRRATNELNLLSGGERSFGTACFVMSLWKCVVDAPFRLMDEVG